MLPLIDLRFRDCAQVADHGGLYIRHFCLLGGHRHYGFSLGFFGYFGSRYAALLCPSLHRDRIVCLAQVKPGILDVPCSSFTAQTGMHCQHMIHEPRKPQTANQSEHTKGCLRTLKLSTCPFSRRIYHSEVNRAFRVPIDGLWLAPFFASPVAICFYVGYVTPLESFEAAGVMIAIGLLLFVSVYTYREKDPMAFEQVPHK